MWPASKLDLLYMCLWCLVESEVEFVKKNQLYSVLVNGTRFEPFPSKRGIRQGDLLSPYLFLLCSQGLSCLLKRAVRRKLVHDLLASRKGHKFLFSFFFCR